MTASDRPLDETVAELDGTLGDVQQAPPVRSSPSRFPPVDFDRYVLGRELGRGYQGVVHEAEDRVLRRRVAMKLLTETFAADADAVARFIAEAQLTAQIDHPHIVPIHDAGRWIDGRPFYTMPILPGGSLAERLDAIRAGTASEPLVRLVRWFSNVCMAVHAAHTVGVVHRDLKPSNMVVGPTGELLVADFGLARPFNEQAASRAVRTSDRAVLGAPVGTPYYMPPEQARGATSEIGPWSDVYALGATLYEILTLRPPLLANSFAELIVAILEATPVDPREATSREVPTDLADLALKCLAKNPRERPASAAELVEVIDGWLEGRFEAERRRAAVRDLLRQARAARDEAEAVGSTADARRRQLEERWHAVPEHASLEEKEPLWEEEEAIAIVERAREDLEARAVSSLEAALRLDPGTKAARDSLVALHLARRGRFLAHGDHGRAREEERRAIAVGGEDVDRRLRAPGVVVLRSSAAVTVAEYAEERGRKHLRGRREVQTDTPIRLPPGSHRLEAEVDGRLVVLPITIGPNETLFVDFEPSLVRRLPPGMALVHGGTSLLGGDERETVGVFVPSFGLAILPVTCDEYLDFLRSLGDVERALAMAPRPTHDGKPYWTARGGVVEMPETDADGDRWDPRFPVFGISYHDVCAYLAWRSSRDGVRYRLPTELEWERAARGADGRTYPWGDRFDPAFCKMRASRGAHFAPEPVGTFEADVSPFGIRDMAGSIAEWTSSFYDAERRARCVKGGAWSTRAHRCRASFRASMLEHHVSGDLGFRLACDV